MGRHALVLATGIILTACSGQSAHSRPSASPPEPEAVAEPTIDPVGAFDFSTDVEGQPVTGTITISGATGGYSGSLSSDMGGGTLRSIAVEGMELSFISYMPDATVYVVLVFEDQASFSGEWDAEGTFGYISGTRR
jgi:hypothetical protein